MYTTEILVSSRNQDCYKIILNILEELEIKDFLYHISPTVSVKLNIINPLFKYTIFFQIEIKSKFSLNDKIKKLIPKYFNKPCIYPKKFYQEKSFQKCKIYITNQLTKNDITYYQIKSYYSSFSQI